MTVAAVDRPRMANGHLYESPVGLYPFQADAVAHAWLRENLIVAADLGLGKTHIFLALAAQLLEAGEIDQVVVVARKNKLGPSEFPRDLAKFTSLRTVLYTGANRIAKLVKAQAAGPVDVLLTSYETGKLDLVEVVKDPRKPKARGRLADGSLMNALDIRHRRTLWVFDEVIRLGNRGNGIYRAYEYAIGQARKTVPQRVLGLHANAMSTDYEQSFNIARIVAPWTMPTVKNFEERYTYGRDQFGRYSFRKAARTEFAELFGQLVYRKRATDPDVASQYPRLVEKLVPVELEAAQRALYEAVGDLYGENWDELPEEKLGALRTALRLTLGHPAAHLRSGSELSRAIVATVGEDRLRQIPSAKTLRLVEDLKQAQATGQRVLVFTFYAETVLPELSRTLDEAGISHAVYSGGRSAADNEAAKEQFKSGMVGVLLSSDAGAEGLNLPEADLIIEYESAHTFDRRTQRFGRATRITPDGGARFVYARTYACVRTLDAAQVAKVLRRQDWQDQLLGDRGAPGHKSAASRKAQLLSGVIL